MAINKAMRAALAALSCSDIDIKKNYLFVRKLEKIKSRRFKKTELYRVLNYQICCIECNVPVRIFIPTRNNTDTLLLFFHGGGWVTGDLDSYDNVCADMAGMTRHRVISVGYRLAPEYRFPAGLKDCYNVAREIFLNYDLFKVKSENIVIIGDSAGGNLSASVSLLARDRKEFFPSKQILIYPVTSSNHSVNSPFASVHENGTRYLLTTKRINDYMELYASSNNDCTNHYFAPLLAKEFSNLPSSLIITAQYDPLRDEGEKYGQKLIEAGGYAKIVRMPDAIHGYFSLPIWFSQVRKTYDIINNFLKDYKYERQ